MDNIEDKITELENNNKSNIINNSNNNSNNITDNRKQIIINYSPGTEPISHLSIDQQKEIMDKEASKTDTDTKKSVSPILKTL
jgi:hypothetical protein